MPNLHIILPLQNEGSHEIKIILEPLPEYFFIGPGEKVFIHGICDSKTLNTTFTIAPDENSLTVYAPGEISGFVDCYIMKDGVRLIPDGH